jgi:DNA-binding protein H-NS
LKKQIAELEEKAAEARRVELAGAKEKIASIMREFGLTLVDIAQPKGTKAVKEHKPAAVKYKHQDKTWSGRGREPLWFKELSPEEREKSLVGQTPETQA